jgi:hypothetical protein
MKSDAFANGKDLTFSLLTLAGFSGFEGSDRIAMSQA